MTKRTILFLYKTYQDQYQNQNNAQSQDANQSGQHHENLHCAAAEPKTEPARETREFGYLYYNDVFLKAQ
jgi:hypothetical protein